MWRILTFETEQVYDRLQQLYSDSEKTEAKAGEETILYLRSRTDIPSSRMACGCRAASRATARGRWWCSFTA